MNDISGIAQTVVGIVTNNPGSLVPIVAAACAVTMVIAIASDAFLRKKQLARHRSKPVDQQPRSSREIRNHDRSLR